MRSGEPCSFPAPETGSVLIVTLWVMFLLAMLGAAVGVQASRRLEASERLRGRAQAYAAARAAVATAVAVLALDTNGWAALAERWADSPADFRDIPCGNGRFSVPRGAISEDSGRIRYGADDEAARIDLNLAGVDVIRGLLAVAGGLEARAADKLSQAIELARWGTNADGSKSTERRPFLCVQDLLGVAGMDEALLLRLEPHVTVHAGTGRVNINTAGPVVLESAMRGMGAAIPGTAPRLVRKILQFREGGGMFTPQALSGGLAGVLSASVELESDERLLLGMLPAAVSLTSDRFRIVGMGECLGHRRFQRRIECVWSRTSRKFVFWNED